MGFFEEVTVNITSYFELEEEEDKGSDRQENSLRVANKTLTILEALPTHMGWRQIFCLLEEMHQHVVAVLQHPKFYASKFKDVEGSTKSSVQCASCNTAITFTDDNLLLGSKPHSRHLLVIGYIREQKVKCILVDRGPAINIMA